MVKVSPTQRRRHMEVDMVADMEVDMVANMEVDKVANKVTTMVADEKRIRKKGACKKEEKRGMQ